MRSIIWVGLFIAGLAAFPTSTSQNLKEKYGHPIAETYLVKPGIAVSVRYGNSGQACSIVIKPEHAHCPLNNPKNTVGDYAHLNALLKELVPEKDRGKPIIGGFVDVICIGGEQDCFGVSEDWENLTIFRSGSSDNQHYASVRWKRDECQGFDPDTN